MARYIVVRALTEITGGSVVSNWLVVDTGSTTKEVIADCGDSSTKAGQVQNAMETVYP